MSAVEVKNTLCFDFGNGSVKPNLIEIANFVKKLDLDVAEVEASYRIFEEKAIFIKFKSEEPMLYALQHNSDELDFHYADGKIVKVHMLPAGGKIQYVRVHGLPPEVPNDSLASVMSRYGKVKSVVKEKFPVETGLDWHTGIRGVYIDVKREIPSSLHFQNWKASIFHEGNKNVCFLCKSEGHRISSCPNRKARKQQETEKEDVKQQHQHDEKQSDSSSYADVVSGSVSLDNIDKEVKTIDEMTAGSKENNKEDPSGGSQVPQRRTYPAYLVAKPMFNPVLRHHTDEIKEERRKLRLREKAGSKQAPPRKKK